MLHRDAVSGSRRLRGAREAARVAFVKQTVVWLLGSLGKCPLGWEVEGLDATASCLKKRKEAWEKKETCVLPDSIVMLMSTSTLLNLMLTFFFSFLSLGNFFFFFFLSFLVTCLWENVLRGYSVKLMNRAFAVNYNREPLKDTHTHDTLYLCCCCCLALKFILSTLF